MVTSAVRDFEGPQRSVRTGTLVKQITWVPSGVIKRGGPRLKSHSKMELSSWEKIFYNLWNCPLP